MNIHWLLSARKDMEDLYNFTAGINEFYAINLYNTILTDIDILQSFPYLGPVETSLIDHLVIFRYLPVAKGKYKVIYSVQNTEIYIYIVFDCRQNPDVLREKLKGPHFS